MIQVDADILLIDEVLAVGDAAFQQKCFDEFARIRDERHDGPARHPRHGRGPALLRPRDAARARARSSQIGDPDDVGNRYLELNFSGGARRRGRRQAERRPPTARTSSTSRASATARAEIVERWFEDEAGERTEVLASGEPRRLRRARALRPPTADDPLFGVDAAERPARHRCSRPRTLCRRPDAGPLRGRARRSIFRVRFDNLLGPGPLLRTPAVARRAAAIAWIDRRERMLTVVVTRPSPARTRSSTCPHDESTAPGARAARGAARARPPSSERRRRADPLGPADQGPVRARQRPAPASGTSTWTLAVTDFKLRFFGSALGYLWQLIRPLLLFGVLYVVFTRDRQARQRRASSTRRAAAGHRALHVLHRGRPARPSSSLVDRENLVRKVEFPRLAVPLVGGPDRAVQPRAEPDPGLRLPARLGRRASRWTWLELPFLLARCWRCSRSAWRCCCRRCYVRYRDIEPIWDVVLQASSTPRRSSTRSQSCSEPARDRSQHLLMLNPFAAILQQARHALIDPSHPTPADLVGWTFLLIPAAIVLLTVIVGFRYFSAQAPRIAERL